MISEAVIALQQRIDALPSVEEFIALADGTYIEDSLWNEAQMAIYYEMQEIADIYDSLSEEEQEQLDITKLMELFEYINSAVMPLATNVNYEQIAISSDSLNGNAILGATESYSGVAMDNSAYFYSQKRYSGDGGLPMDGKIEVSGVPYYLATGENPDTAYDGKDCIRLTSGYKTQKMDLETIGVYQNIYVFATAGGPGAGNYAKFNVALQYTDGTSDSTTYQLYDWYDTTNVEGVQKYTNVRRMNINTYTVDYNSSTSAGPVIHSATIKVNRQKLLQSITFTMQGKNTGTDTSGLYCCIFAVTGATPAGVPDKPVATQATKLEGDTTGTFTANWNSVDGASGYYLDVSTDRQFKSFVGGYNNFNVGNVLNYSVSQNVDNNTVYYYRVRAVNSNGQSLSSNRIATDLPLWIRQALNDGDQSKVSYDAETNTITFSEDVTLKDTINLPENDETIIDLKSNTVTAPVGKPAIAASGTNTNLKVSGSGTGEIRQGTLEAGAAGDGGIGSATIDFNKAGGGSTITVSGSHIKGGDGATAEDEATAGGSGGAGIVAGSGVNIEVGENAIVSGGNGGSTQNGNGGSGGAGISGGNVSVTQNGSVTGGNGGNSANGTGGNGGTGVTDSANINSSGSVTGGNGGDSSNGHGGNGGSGVAGNNVTNSGNVSGGNGGNGTTAGGNAGNAGTSSGTTNSGNSGTAHEHTWKYAVNDEGNGILAYCTQDTGSDICKYQGMANALSLTLAAVQDITYNGQKQEAAIIKENQISGITGALAGNITYYQENTQTEPVNAGIYTAKVTVGDVAAAVTCEIKQASQKASVTMDSYVYGDTVSVPGLKDAVENPKVTYYYNQTGNAFDGKKWENMTSTTLNAGTYYLYAVLEATDNYQGVVTEVTEYRVEPRTAELSWEPTKFIYNGKEQAPTATVTNRVGNDICIVTVSGGQIDANTVNVPEYTAVAEKLSNPNYVLPSNGAATHFTIAKAQQEAPIVGGVSETILGKEDGRISNLNSDMEIRAEDATNYTKIMATDVTFAPGIYYVRYAEKTNYDASAETRIIIGEGRMLQISLPASQMGYEITTQDRKLSWHGTTKLNFKLQPGYSKTDSFAVKVNGKAVELTDDQYVIRAAEDDQVITVEGVADITAPEGQITIAGNNWKEMLNTISFGLFFKEKQDVTITAVDAGSGVKEIDYYVSEKELDSTTVQQVAAWQIYTEKFSIAPNHGYIVYARLTDYAGNIKYLSSDGVVLYTDAETVTPAIDYYKASGENKTARVSLNDNTIREVRDADKVLQEGTDYTISASGDEIIFKNSYLQSLAADNIPYIIYISYYPLGKEYVEGIHNQAPKQTTVQLTISRQTCSITGIGNLTKIYDGEAVTEPTYKANTDASVTVEYKAKDAEDTAYTTVAPVNVGEYTVRLSASETENYTAATVTQNFRIVARELTVQVIAQNKEYDGTVAAEVSATVETGVKDQSISVNGITGTFKDSNAGQNKEVMLDSSKVSISSDNEGTLLANYKISYPVTAKADITQAHLIILPTQAQKTYGEADPQIGYQVIGWKQKEQPEGILIGSLSRETGENVGTYRYTLGSLKDRNDNYKLQLAEGDEVPVFAIVQKTITEDKISIGTDENGKVQVIIRDLVVDGNKTLKEDIDYTVVRSDTEKVETIVIKGKGNYQFEITKKVAKPEWKGNIATTVVTEPEVEKIAPALEPVAERNAKQTLVNIVKDDTLKKRLENITPDLNYNVLMYLEVKQADSKIEPEEKKLIADSIRESEQLPVGTVVGKYMDLALYMTYTVSNDAGVLESGTEKITNTSDEKMGTGKGYKQIIRFTIPEELRNSDSRMERTYYIIRVHEENGTTNVDVLNTVREGNVLSFETDKFSTYVIAYADQKKQEKADDSDKDDNISDARVVAQNSQAVSAPKTGDNSHMVVWITLFLLSAGGMTGVVAVNYRKRKKSAK